MDMRFVNYHVLNWFHHVGRGLDKHSEVLLGSLDYLLQKVRPKYFVSRRYLVESLLEGHYFN